VASANTKPKSRLDGHSRAGQRVQRAITDDWTEAYRKYVGPVAGKTNNVAE
jgi:hypothetical protein